MNGASFFRELGDAEAFKSDLKFAASEKGMPVVTECLAGLPSFHRIDVDGGRFAFVTSFAEAHGLDKQQALLAFRLLACITEAFFEKNLDVDRLEKEKEDLRASEGLSSEQIEYLIELIKKFQDLQEPLTQALAYREEIDGVLPMLKASVANVDMRVIMDESYTSVVEFAPIASLALSLDSGLPDSFAFQATELAIDDLIECLQDAKSIMEKARVALEKRQ